jgi:phage-related protein
MMATRNIIVRAGADFSGLSAAFRQAGIQTVQFQNQMTHSLGQIGLAMEGLKLIGETIIGTFEGINEFAQGAGELDGRLSSLDKRLGNSATAFMEWGDTVGKSMGLSKAMIIEQGATISAMLMPLASTTSQLTQMTEDMMKDVAIVSAATGRSMDEVSQRMISALAGNGEAVRMIDLNVMEMALTHSQAYKQIANGTPWAQLNAEQKEAILLTEMHRQVVEKFGNTVIEDVATRMNRFHSSLSNVKTSLQMAFQPILFTVLPILTAFIDKINRALMYVTAFFQVLFGYSGAVQNQTKGIKDQAGAINDLASAHGKLANAAGKSGKDKAKKTKSDFTASFDQVHTIPTSSSASGAGSAADAAGIADPMEGMTEGLIDDGKKQKEEMDKIRKNMAALVADLKDKFSNLTSIIQNHKTLIVSALAGIGAALTTFLIVKNWSSIVASVTGAFSGLSAIMGAILSPIGLVVIAIAALVGIFVYLWKTNKDFRNGVIKLWDEISGFFKKIGKDMWSSLKEVWDKYGKDIYENLKGIVEKIGNIILSLWNKFFKPVLMDGIKNARDLWDKHLRGMFGAVADCVGKIIADGLKILNKFVLPVISYLVDKLAPTFKDVFKYVWAWVDWAAGLIADSVKGLIKIFGGIIDFLTGVFTGDWKQAWNGVSTVFKTIAEGLKEIFKAPLNWIIGQINNVINSVNKLSSQLPDFLGGKALHIPNIPKLARGGITSGPMLAMIGDNPGGREVVAPLDRLQDIMSSSVANAVNATLAFQGGNRGQSGDIILNIDGRSFARIVKPYIDGENKRVGTNVRLKQI